MLVPCRLSGACWASVQQDASAGVPPDSKGDADAGAHVGDPRVVGRQPCVRYMVQHDRQTHRAGQLIPGLHTLPEQQPGTQAFALRERRVEMAIVDAPAEAASDEEPFRQREQRVPGTTAPGQPDIRIVCRTHRVERETQVRPGCSEDAQQGRRGEQDLDVEIGAGFDMVAQEMDIMGQHAQGDLINPAWVGMYWSGPQASQCHADHRQPAAGHTTAPRFQRPRTTAGQPSVPQVSTTHTAFSLGDKPAALLQEARGRRRPRRQTRSAVRETSWRVSVAQKPNTCMDRFLSAWQKASRFRRPRTPCATSWKTMRWSSLTWMSWSCRSRQDICPNIA